jgi:hypothetical protein
MDMLKDVWGYLRTRKKYWLLPLIATLFMLGAIFLFSSGSALAPFIYTLF